MPGTTPNRGYPYPLPADPFDPAGDIQRLAEAIDLDVLALDNTIVQRPIAVVSSRVSQTFPADVITECEFDFLDIDTAGITNLSVQPTRLTPTSAGLWLAWATFADPVAQATLHDLNLRVNGGDLIRSGIHLNNSFGESEQALTLVGMSFMDGIDDYFTVTYQPLGGLSDFRTKNRQFACARLTNT